MVLVLFTAWFYSNNGFIGFILIFFDFIIKLGLILLNVL